MNPFGVESHDISKALVASQYKSKEAKKHEKKAAGNIAGGAVAFGGATAAVIRNQNKAADAFSNASRGRNYGMEAEANRRTVETLARSGRISRDSAEVSGNKYRADLGRAAHHNAQAVKGLKQAKNAKKAAIGLGAAGVAGYGNGLRHAIKADQAEKKSKIKKSAWGIEH